MKRIAIVEDDRLFNEALYQTLKKADYAVDRAHSYGEGTALIDKQPDLFIVDVNLPAGDGFTLCRRIRESGQTPVMFLTARDDESDMIRAFDLGADDYLVKPFPMAVLLKHVEAILRRSSGQNQRFSYLELAMDFDRKSVTYRGEAINLTAKEYKVLELLVKNRGRVVTREMMLEQVWDADGAFVEENTVNVTLSRLRKKIEPNLEEPIFIRNVFGIGYTFGK
ncbi:response regulator transcription factor [Anaerovoracaceae bacterium 41-7]|uniref:response regulator transcription factor n=1 Tax=Anaerovoracaceae TaxID=543314 RepID=UPI00137B1B96|nr:MULTISPECIES: response regulator transcription factor [Clostridia]MCI9476817.1 response regulator transcription factor [Emergencia sp.]NCE98052.1 DNA-binding response regulator [Emergencia sp. 1XD21-10]